VKTLELSKDKVEINLFKGTDSENNKQQLHTLFGREGLLVPAPGPEI
jgi:hypothetical protein